MKGPRAVFAGASREKSAASLTSHERILTPLHQLAPIRYRRALYAVSEGGRVAVIAMATAKVVTTFDLTGGQPMALMRVAAA